MDTNNTLRLPVSLCIAVIIERWVPSCGIAALAEMTCATHLRGRLVRVSSSQPRSEPRRTPHMEFVRPDGAQLNPESRHEACKV